MKRWLRSYCLLAGGMDSLTGALLVAAPVTTLALMGVTRAPAEPIYLRFVGVFVGAVGLSYLYPFLLAGAARTSTLRANLVFTLAVRLCVALFIAVAVGSRRLEPAWAVVGVTDGVLAFAQFVILRRGSLDAPA